MTEPITPEIDEPISQTSGQESHENIDDFRGDEADAPTNEVTE